MKGVNLGNVSNKIANTSLGAKARSFFAQDFFRNQIVVWMLILTLIANLADWISLKLFIKPVDFPIILHYNVYFGVDMLGSWKQAFALPFLGLVLFIINFSLSLYFYHQKERIASHILLMATLMLQLSLIIASISVIIINY
jgi:hypothetical protein